MPIIGKPKPYGDVLTVKKVVILSMILAVTLIFNVASADDGEAIREAEEELLKALKSVKEAEAAGSRTEDLSILVEKLNRALSLLDGAVEAYEAGMEGEAGNIASQSKAISQEVESASAGLKAQALKSRSRLKLTVMILIPLLAFSTSLIAELVYSRWLEYSKERFLKMRVKLAEED